MLFVAHVHSAPSLRPHAAITLRTCQSHRIEDSEHPLLANQPHVIHDRPAPKEMCAAGSWLVLTSTGRRLFGACGTVGTVAHTARRTDGRDFKHKHTRMYVCAARRGFSMTCARSATSTAHSSRRAECGHKPLWPLTGCAGDAMILSAVGHKGTRFRGWRRWYPMRSRDDQYAMAAWDAVRRRQTARTRSTSARRRTGGATCRCNPQA